MDATQPMPESDRGSPAGLSRSELAICLGLSLAVFFLHEGPFWQHKWRIDASIWLSYLVIPFIVAAVLALFHELGWRRLALGTIEVTCWKFGITYFLAQTMWMFSSPPPRAEVPAPSWPDAPAVAARSVGQDPTGSIEGTVEDSTGREVAGIAVFVESGLDAYTFAPSRAGASFAVRSGAIEPGVVVVELHDQLRAHSSDGKLHTLVASQGDSDLFNLPLQSSGAESATEVRRGQGVASVRCAVHERAGEVARLVVVAHPFHAVLDSSGRFAWSGVPAARVTLSAVAADGRVARVEANVVARETASVHLVLAGEARK
jgi:hypothetical protein